MKHEPYLPQTDEGKVTWLNTFAAKKTVHAALFGFSSASVTQTNEDALMFAFLIGYIDQIKTDAQELTAYKDLLRDGPASEPTATFPTITVIAPGELPAIVPADIFKRAADDAAVMKKHANYSTALGEDFGIIGAEIVFDPAEYKTTITGEAFPNYVELKFFKGQAEGVNFYRRLEGTSVWKKVALANTSPFQDQTPLAVPGQAEIREYMAIGVIKNKEIGVESAVIKVVFGGIETE